jgi:hypothetical protein
MVLTVHAAQPHARPRHPRDKFQQPVLNDDNRLKLAAFGINLRGGVTMARCSG